MECRLVPGRIAMALALLLLLGGCATVGRVPADGLYAGELCTQVVSGPLQCGAAEVFLARDRAKVRVSDFIYDLTLGQEQQLDVYLVHGRVLVDVWSGRYAWDRSYLRFIDQDRRTAYRVRFADAPPLALPGSD